ncbi:DUF397 domain-containing protein [Nocardia otitidiscaviarum]|uniref:DUF397 domain-containing protein n=1 Tax=Nocardia otitidiscaviarum TaxID=1823 RepID=UPI00245677B9|nr:DUF397 domain-containing protein [Nocardia otitidiscaviarum]
MKSESTGASGWVESAANLAGAAWFKSTRSPSQDSCVEVAWGVHGGVGVRDSKNPMGPALILESAQWDAFNAAVRSGRFDLPK